jgi:hypothetical protein
LIEVAIVAAIVVAINPKPLLLIIGILSSDIQERDLGGMFYIESVRGKVHANHTFASDRTFVD